MGQAYDDYRIYNLSVRNLLQVRLIPSTERNNNKSMFDCHCYDLFMNRSIRIFSINNQSSTYDDVI